MSLFSFGVSFFYLYLAGSVFFDTAHWLLHKWSKSQWKFLRWLAYCHQFHHLYYNRALKFNNRYLRQNAWIALPLEMACKILGSIAGWLLAHQLMTDNIDIAPLVVVSIFEAIRTLVVIAMSGQDSNHVAYDTVPKDHSWLFVGPEFHALHHVHPDRYMGSMVKLFDWIAGTAYSLRSKRVVLTGGSGAFGKAIEKQLLAEGVKDIQKLRFGKDWTHQDFSRLGPVLEEADILVLAHGTKGMDAMDANCNSSIRFAELFLERKSVEHMRQGKTIPEIWYVGSEIEVHPAWGIPEMQRYSASKRAFLPYARALYDDPRVTYRHIVPAAFESSMGKAIVSPDWAARVALWWIHRGAYYVPVTYTGLAFLNFFKFLLLVRPAPTARQIQGKQKGIAL
ncbi:hypothetical protein BBP40_005139 [Aspergillus hancockii]|nr:hypothetical protein BBP40_005139 [Aspergillus hancockii]